MYHFISGLPRAGSTLLASILRQNPKIEASIMSPVGHIVTSTVHAMGLPNEAEGFLSDIQRRRILERIFEGYYGHYAEDIIFDNNRRWTANVALLAELFPNSKIVCCVRSPVAIVDSFERLHQKNSLHVSVISGSQTNTTVYERVVELMRPTGVLGFALNGLKSAWFGPYKRNLILVPYEDLAQYPALTMADLTKLLDLPSHDYDFKKIYPIPGAKEFDRHIGTPGLHDLMPEVVYENRPSILPPDVWNSLPQPFWVNNAVTPSK
jgi:sulfotransferase